MKNDIKNLIPEVRITNPKRKKRIVEFIDKDHDVMTEYYELMDQNLSIEKMQKALKKMI